MMTYAVLFDKRLNCSPEAARALVKRMRPSKANDGKILVIRGFE
jgi:hypothetical protein